MSQSLTVELIAIGDELLSGIRANGHLVYLGDHLLQHGLPIIRSTEIRDEPDELKTTLEAALLRSNIIITTGGLGPTEDDLTVPTIAQTLGRKLNNSSIIEQDIREFFRKRGKTPTDNNFRQARIIDGAEPLRNPNGTAPGQWLEDDEHDVLIILLPGPPRELQPMFEEVVLPKLIESGRAKVSESAVHLRTMGIGESQLADMLEPVLKDYRPGLRVAYCATSGYVDVRLSTTLNGPSACKVRQLAETCREIMGDGFVGFGHPDAACQFLKQLRCLNKSIAVAESCTGGLLASRFTDVPGASKSFMGGIICYTNDVKINVLGVPSAIIDQHGAVSAECAAAMATAAAELMECEYAIAITGYAGPEGGDEPVGTIYLGYHSPLGVWSKKAVLSGNRTAVKERAVDHALDFIRRKLKKYQVHDLLDSLRC